MHLQLALGVADSLIDIYSGDHDVHNRWGTIPKECFLCATLEQTWSIRCWVEQTSVLMPGTPPTFDLSRTLNGCSPPARNRPPRGQHSCRQAGKLIVAIQ